MNPKEKYFSAENIENQASNLIEEIAISGTRRKVWDARMTTSALIVTDVQNYFFSPDSHAFLPSAPAIINNIKALIDFFHSASRPVIFTRHVNSDENANSMTYWWDDMIHDGSWLSELTDELDVRNSRVIVKHQYEAFYQTGLEDFLIKSEVKYPVVCGVKANLCCETTVRSAFVRGFRPVLPIDATAANNREYHLATFRNLCYGFMPLLTTGEIIQMLQK
ncbi:MAG: isochorismatase family protein [Bacteroidales bacterium]